MDRKEYFAKITVPHVFHKLLPRKEIAEIIDGASLAEAVCLVAPYGYGKTLSVISYLHEGRHTAAWLSLGIKDDSERAFWAGISASIKRYVGWSGNVNDVECDTGYQRDAQSYARNALAEAESLTNIPILVIDNLQSIRNHELLRSIKDFLQSLLGRWRVIIMSRAELPPVFNDLMLKRNICLIKPMDLSFSLEEMTEFFLMNSVQASEESIMNIRSETEGWPAPLNVALTLSRGGELGYGETARTYVMGFFESEIWGDLPEEVRDFLLKSSILDVLTPEACRAVTDYGAPLAFLEWLFMNGIFISRLEERNTYRYHRVFHDYLLEKLAQSNIDEKSLYKKAAWWLYEQNEFVHAFPHFLKAGDLYGINQVIKVMNPAVLGGIENYLEVAGNLTNLNLDELKPYPVIMARIAFIEFIVGNVTRMHEIYCMLLEWMEPGLLNVSPVEYAEFVWEVGWLCYLNPEEKVKANKRHEEWCNYNEYVPHLKTLHLSRAAVMRFPSILRGLRDYSETVFTVGSWIKQTELHQTPILDEHALLEMYLIFAEYCYETEQFTKARESVWRVMPVAEERKFTDIYFICTVLLVKIMRATRDTKEIQTLINRMESMIVENDQNFLLTNFHAFKLRNDLAEGHIGLDPVFEKENANYKNKPWFFLLYRHVTMVRGLISMGNNNEALMILDNLDLICQRYDRIFDSIEVNILKSITLNNLGGHDDEAARYMIKALKSAEKFGYIRVFADEAMALWPVLEPTVKRMRGNFARSVLLSCKKELIREGVKPKRKSANADLTKTEIKILKCLQMGMSYKETALDNGIRVSTVKSHVHSIYSKLDVNNKTSAIIAVEKLGLLE